MSGIRSLDHEMDVTTQGQNNFLAFRSSCDRCRYMKLKCLSGGNDTHEPCERCSKAKLRCTYSRRTNLRRQHTTAQDNGSDGQESHESQTAAPDVTIDDQGSGQSEESPTSIVTRLPEVSSEPMDSFCYSNALDVVSDELLWADWDIPSTSSTSSALWANHSLGGFTEHRASISAQCTLSLANLAVELGECLQMLRGDMRTQQSIDDYPIGHIRHLSQAFVVSTQNRPSLSTTDVSTSLLLLSCYVSLRKLYINAFSSIQDHLPIGNDSQQVISHDPRTVRLRGMDMLGERCMRSYTAFNITLDLLHNCDAALGLCAACRPSGQSNRSNSLVSATHLPHCVSPSDIMVDSMDELPSNSACIACALPVGSRKEAMSIFSAIADQEHALHEVIAMLRGTLRQRMGLL